MMDVVNSPFVGMIWFRTSIEKYSYSPYLESKKHWTNNTSLQCSSFYNVGGMNPSCMNYPPLGNDRGYWWIAFLDRFYYEDEPQHNEWGVSFSIARFRILNYIIRTWYNFKLYHDYEYRRYVINNGKKMDPHIRVNDNISAELLRLHYPLFIFKLIFTIQFILSPSSSTISLAAREM